VKITVKLSRTKETKEIHLETESTVNDLLRNMNLKPDTLILMSDNVPIPIDNALKDGQDVAIIQVSSGG
jgi:sulfur carrier protein ThiS